MRPDRRSIYNFDVVYILATCVISVVLLLVVFATPAQAQTVDTDRDGIPDRVEKHCTEVNCDHDSDGVEDFEDQDSDNDGIPDREERGISCSNYSSCNPADSNENNKADYRESHQLKLPRSGALGTYALVIGILIVLSGYIRLREVWRRRRLQKL